MNKDDRPNAPIIDADGNVFNLIGICSRSLKDAGYPDKAKEMTERVTSSKSYEDALARMCEYVNPVSQYGYDEYDDFDCDEIEI